MRETAYAKLNLALHNLRQLRREGFLGVDHETASWKEWRRRQALRKSGGKAGSPFG